MSAKTPDKRNKSLGMGKGMGIAPARRTVSVLSTQDVISSVRQRTSLLKVVRRTSKYQATKLGNLAKKLRWLFNSQNIVATSLLMAVVNFTFDIYDIVLVAVKQTPQHSSFNYPGYTILLMLSHWYAYVLSINGYVHGALKKNRKLKNLAVIRIAVNLLFFFLR